MIQILFAFGLFLLTRVLLSTQVGLAEIPGRLWPLVFLRGVFFDAATLCFIVSPFLIVWSLLPLRVLQSKFTRGVLQALTVLWMFFWVSLSVFEYVYWMEFATRFNFIALDYLIYTNEVVRNIWESYPIVWIFSGLAALVIGIFFWLRARFPQAFDVPIPTRRRRIACLAVGLLLPWISFRFADVDQMETLGNAYAAELSGNGVFTLAAAARRNELDYDRFYKTIPQDRAHQILKSMDVEWRPDLRKRVEDRWGDDHPNDPLPPMITRRPRHIVLISVESLSASFLGSYGSSEQLTPEIDKLAACGLKFTRVFATGTRTVRGLEALSLGTPPVPGQAIVRRPKNEHLCTIGEILARQEYEPYFFYGGYGYFDNMNAFFRANNYTVLDRSDFPAESIVFENVWGVADESLYANVVDQLDKVHARGKKFFAHVMTTTNHRPYTYPEGRIDIPSPGGRRGAVKYTDYALGQFIKNASTKPWFTDTLFVITADHCASVAGKMNLPIAQYQIPLILYAPGLIKGGVYDRIISQIDIPPTLIDLLGVAGDDEFFGKELPEQTGAPRVFISNYQSLGYYKNNQLIVLKPKQRVESYRIDPTSLEGVPMDPDPGLVEEAVAYYQTASRAFRRGDLRLMWR